MSKINKLTKIIIIKLGLKLINLMNLLFQKFLIALNYSVSKKLKLN